MVIAEIIRQFFHQLLPQFLQLATVAVTRRKIELKAQPLFTPESYPAGCLYIGLRCFTQSVVLLPAKLWRLRPMQRSELLAQQVCISAAI